MLGEEDRAEQLLNSAAEEELQVLIVFTVTVAHKQTSNGPLTTNDAEVHVYDVKNRKVLFKIAKIRNVDVQKKRAAESDDDPLEIAIKRIKGNIETSLTQKAMPQLTQQQVLDGRLVPLVQSRHRNPLPVLAELMFFTQTNLLSQENLQNGFEAVIGQQHTATLLTGSEDQKRGVADIWLAVKSSDVGKKPEPQQGGQTAQGGSGNPGAGGAGIPGAGGAGGTPSGIGAIPAQGNGNQPQNISQGSTNLPGSFNGQPGQTGQPNAPQQ